MTRIRPLFVGFFGGALLLAIFFGLLTLLESWSFAYGRFLELWWLMLPLVIGFGFQVGLYWHIRQWHSEGRARTASVATTGGISTGAMVACCLHHGTDLLPVLGFSALASFLTRYQPLLLAIGIVSNLYGISLMLETIKNMGLYQLGRGLLARLVQLNLRWVRLSTIALSLVVVLLFFLITACSGKTPVTSPSPDAANQIFLSAQEDSRGGLTVVVEGVLRLGEPLELKVSLDTHTGSLDFDLTKLATLEDSLGGRYFPTEWRGSPPEGHHRSGSLLFPPLQGKPEWLRLTLRNLYGVPQRTFTWQIR